VSAFIIRPEGWQGWVVLSIAAVAALPFLGLASLYTFAFRAALFLGHWPHFNNPDPKDLPAHFHLQTEFLEFLIPTIASIAVTWLFVVQTMRFATWPRRIEFAAMAAFLLWLFAYVFVIGDPFGVFYWIMD
jgi:hypothetical protein